MQEVPIDKRSILAPFFTDTYDSCADAFLDGIMGRGFADSLDDPTYGVIQVGNYCFFGGNGDGPLKKNVVNILKNLCKDKHMKFIPLSISWNQTLSEIPDLERTIRYALNKPALTYFNQKKLAAYITKAAFDPKYVGESTSRKFVIKPVDSFTYTTVQKEEWSSGLVENYKTYFEFVQNGLGFLILEGATGKVVAGATSFSTSADAYELQIATKPGYEGKGLATALSARFILECINLNKQPSWDAANLTSVHIAEKLGYQFEEEYVAYCCKA